jgi:hypothetical protein
LGVVQLLVERGADIETKTWVRFAEPAAAPRGVGCSVCTDSSRLWN